MSKAFSGRDADDLTLDRLAAEELGADDVRIHPDTLRVRADHCAGPRTKIPVPGGIRS